MTTISTTGIQNMVTASRLAITNALADSSILATLSGEGYTSDELNKGLSLCDALETQQSAKTTSLGTQKQSTLTVGTSLEVAQKAISLFRDKGRSCFTAEGNPEAWEALKLGKRVPEATNAFISFGREMVKNASENDAIMATLSAAGYDAAKLDSIKGKLDAADVDNQAQERNKGTRQGTTKGRNTAASDLRKWWTAFKRIARKLLTAEQLSTLQI